MIARLLAFSCSRLLARRPAAAETVVVHAGRLIADAVAARRQGPSTITIVDGRIQSVAAGPHPAARRRAADRPFRPAPCCPA